MQDYQGGLKHNGILSDPDLLGSASPSGMLL